MHEVGWLAYIVLFFVPTCVATYILYIECATPKKSMQEETAEEEVLESAGPHRVVQPEQPPLPTPAEVVPHVTPPKERAPPPASKPTTLYPDPHAASAAKTQMPCIYIHAIGLR